MGLTDALRRHGRRLRKHLWWMSVAIAGDLVCRGWLPESALKSGSDVGGNFLQTFGGIYGVIVAFVIYVVWQQHNDTQAAVEKEAVALAELYGVTGWFTTWAKRDEVRARLRAYATVVPALNGQSPARPEQDDKRLLDASLHDFLAHTPAAAEERLFAPALDLFHELNEAREHRLTVSRLRLPEGLRWFVFIGGAISVATLWLLWVESLAVHLVITAGMTWVIVAASSLIVDLDDPYGGDFVIDWGRFNQAAAHMDELSCPPGA